MFVEDILLWPFRKLWEFFQELLKTLPQSTKWDPIFTNGRLEIAIQISPHTTIVVGLGLLGIYVRLAPGDLDDGREFDLDDRGEFDLDEEEGEFGPEDFAPAFDREQDAEGILSGLGNTPEEEQFSRAFRAAWSSWNYRANSSGDGWSCSTM